MDYDTNVVKGTEFGNKKRVNNIIDLYNNRKIYNVKTAIGILDKLIDTKKKSVRDSGIKLYNESIAKYQNAEPLSVRRSRIKTEKTENRNKFRNVIDEINTKIKSKAVVRIQKLLRNTITYKVLNVEKAMHDKVFTIALQADRVGSDVWTIAYLYKAYAKALSLLPKKMHFYFYSEVTSDLLGKNSRLETILMRILRIGLNTL